MLDHVSIGVKDLGRSRRFYDAVLAPLGYACSSPGESSLGYGRGREDFWVLAAAHPVAADKDSGLHLCFKADDREAVEGFHKAALAAGGKDNGKPGLRADYGAGYYAAFVIDPDGYRLEAHAELRK